jgi:uncharacterized Rmd1/YagE family protein
MQTLFTKIGRIRGAPQLLQSTTRAFVSFSSRSPGTLPTKPSLHKNVSKPATSFGRERLETFGIVNSRIRPPHPPDQDSIRLHAFHAAHAIDIINVLTKVFRDLPIRHSFGKMSVLMELPDEQYICVYRFGSVVFFNVPMKEIKKWLTDIKLHGNKVIASGFERKEHFEVRKSNARPAVTGTYCVVPELNMNAVAVIGNILAQTVALDTYSDTVDALLTEFASINAAVNDVGNFEVSKKSHLFKVVAHNNSIFIDMISKLGIKDRSDAAWNLPQLQAVHEGLREEFEILERFEHIEFKLDLIQQNAKFFMEVMHNQKSYTMEWTVALLISFECLLMIMDMSGTGENVFDALRQSGMWPPKNDVGGA